jgi:DNA-binding transcriptional MerR regulator
MNQAENLTDKLFSIQFAANQSGLSVHTIRAWEKRYNAIIPARDEGGRRQYSRQNIDRLKKMSELTKIGNSISEIAYLSDEALDNLHQEYVSKHQVQVLATNLSDSDIEKTVQNLLLALYAFKLDVISYEFEKIKQDVTPRDLAFKILMPLLKEIGENVQRGTLDIYQEHALTSIIRFHVSHILYQHMCKTNCSPFSVIITTPEKERHEFGIMIAALLCAHYSIKFYYLGVDLPVTALTKAAEQIGSEYVILGVSQEMNNNNYSFLKDYMQKLSEKINPKKKIWVGGCAPMANKNFSNIHFIETLEDLDKNLKNLNHQ